MSRKGVSIWIGLLVLVALVFATGTWAQTSRGTVNGTITDVSGAVVPNADVQLVNVATNVVRGTKSTEAGLYRFDAVDLGTYKLVVTAAGFSTAEATGIEVRANQLSVQDFALKVGGSNQVVQVSGEASAVGLQTEEQLRGASIESRKLTQLPISNQNSLNLMLTVPGIAPTRVGNGGGVGAVNGSRARANKFLIDGVDNNDISVAGQSATMYNNDAIQEVSIQTADYTAEFGRSGGAVVNQITKSGTNNLHGTMAWVYNTQLLNATTQTQRIAHKKPKFHEHIPAFTAGGPVVIPHLYDGHNKTFWFVAGQWDHYTSAGSLSSFTVPTAAGISTLQGYASSCPNVALYLTALGGMAANNQTGTLNIAVPASVYATAPTCNGNPRTGVTIPYGTGTRVVPNSYKTYNTQFRVDHAISTRQNLSVRVFRANEKDQLYTAGISAPFDTPGQFANWSAGITHTFSITNTLTNELRLSYARTIYGWFPSFTDPLSTIPTFTYGTLSGIGMSANYPQGRIPNTYQLQDVVTKVIGHHQIRMGGEIFRQIARQIAPASVRGAVTYSNSGTGATLVTGFANFMDDFSGWGTTTRVSKVFGSTKYNPSYMAGSMFFQDAWKMTPDLTLNLGLRWDYFGQPANIFPYPMVSFDPTAFSKERIPAAKRNFGPTVGFAWNPKNGPLTGDGKLVVRGGLQIGYDTLFNNLLSNMATGAPNNPTNPNVIPPSTGRGYAGSYSTYFPAMVAAAFSTAVSTSSQFTNPMPTPYSYRWSFGIQREMPAGIFVDLAYVGSASHHLNQQQELNPFGAPVQNATTGVWSNGVRLIPAIGGRMVRANAANSNYNGLQLEVKKRYSETPFGSVLFSSSYTWSKTLGVVDDVFSQNTGTGVGSGVYMSCNPLLCNGWRNSDYGPSDNDRRHMWVSSVVWELPSKMKMPVVAQVVNGWSLSTNFFLRSGIPFSILNGSDRNLDGTSANDRPDIGNPSAPLNSAAQAVSASTCSTGWQTLYGTGCVSPTDVRFLYYPTGTNAPILPGHQMQRNSLYTPAFVSSDVNIIKTFKMTESKSLEFQLQMFNVANSQNYTFTPWNNNMQTMFQSKNATTGMPSLKFLDYTQADTGNRTMTLQLKFKF